MKEGKSNPHQLICCSDMGDNERSQRFCDSLLKHLLD